MPKKATADDRIRIPVLASAPIADPVAVAAANLGLSRATAYQEISAGRLRTFTVGRRRLVSREAQLDYVRQREAEAGEYPERGCDGLGARLRLQA